MLQSENDDVDLLRVPVGLTSNTRTSQHYSVSNAGSILNPSSTNLKNQHRFAASNDSSIVALLGNSALFFIRDDTTTMQTELHGTVLYAEGCRANHLQPSHSNHFVYVTFENCPPLRVTVADLAALVAPHSDLTNRKVLTVDALDFDTDMITFHIYIGNDLSRIQILHESDLIRTVHAEDIGSCQQFTDLHPLGVTLSPNDIISMVIDCTDESGNPRRYLHYYDSVAEESRDTFAIGTVQGRPLASWDSSYLAIIDASSSSSSLVLYNISEILQTPVTLFYDRYIQAQFMTGLEQPHLMVSPVGADLELIDLDLLVASHGEEGRRGISNTRVLSCTPTCPPVGVVSPDQIMASVFNEETQQYDILHMTIGADITTTRIPSVSSQPHAFTFLQAPPTPSPSSETMPPPTTTQSPLTTTQTPLTGSTEDTGTTSIISTTSPARQLSVGATVGISVAAVAITAFLIILAVLLTIYQKINQKLPIPEEEDPPDALKVDRDVDGVIVAPPPPVVVLSRPAGAQETGLTLEVIDLTQYPGGSNLSTPHLTPRDPRYSEQCTDL